MDEDNGAMIGVCKMSAQQHGIMQNVREYPTSVWLHPANDFFFFAIALVFGKCCSLAGADPALHED
jgi:hypothetical protein